MSINTCSSEYLVVGNSFTKSFCFFYLPLNTHFYSLVTMEFSISCSRRFALLLSEFFLLSLLTTYPCKTQLIPPEEGILFFTALPLSWFFRSFTQPRKKKILLMGVVSYCLCMHMFLMEGTSI